MRDLFITVLDALLLGVVGAAGVQWLFSRGRQRELALLEKFALGYPGKVEYGEDGVVVLYRGVPVTVDFGTPPGRAWRRGLAATARYAVGGGPIFEATPHDELAYTRPANGTVTLHARIEHGYDLRGDHREARALLSSVVKRTEMSVLTCPRFSSSGLEVRVELPEQAPNEIDAPAQKMLEELVALTAELALFGQSQLATYGDALGGSMTVDGKRRPMLWVTFRTAAILSGRLELRWRAASDRLDAFRLVLALSAPLRSELRPLADAIAQLPRAEARQMAAQFMRRASLEVEGDDAVLLLDTLVNPDELEVAVEVLGLVSGTARPDGPFR